VTVIVTVRVPPVPSTTVTSSMRAAYGCVGSTGGGSDGVNWVSSVRSRKLLKVVVAPELTRPNRPSDRPALKPQLTMNRPLTVRLTLAPLIWMSSV
jgi:hypothetical protein